MANQTADETLIEALMHVALEYGDERGGEVKATPDVKLLTPRENRLKAQITALVSGRALELVTE